MKRKILLVPLALLLAVSLVACAAPAPAPAPTPVPAPAPAPAPEEPTPPSVIEWTLDTYWPVTIYVAEGAQEFCDRVNERSEGGFVITPIFGSALGVKGPDVAVALGEGVFELAYTAFPYIAVDIPVLGILGLPALFHNIPEGLLGLNILTPYYRSELEKRNIKQVGSVFPFPKQLIWSKQPITEIEDMKGLTFRGFSAEMTLVLEEVGVIVISMPMPEVYTALERGMLDAIIGSVASAQAVNAWEVLDYGIDFTFALADTGLLANKDAWEALPAEYQLIVTEEADRFAAWGKVQAVMQEEEAWVMLTEKGMTKITPSPQLFEDMAKVATPIWGAWAQEKGGVAAEALAEVREVLGR